MKRVVRPLLLTLLSLLSLFPGAARAGDGLPPALRGVGVDLHPGRQVPLDRPFFDEAGHTVRLGELLGGRPAVLVLAYYECPMLCTQVLNNLTGSLRMLSLDAGRDFSVIVVSINPNETPALAAAKKQGYLERYGRPGAEDGWHLLTGREPDIAAVADAVGFHYGYDPAIRQYAHASGITILTPQGKVSQYLLGLDFPPRQLRLALVDASAGKIGNVVDRVLLFCYHYDPLRGRNGAIIIRTIQVSGLLVLLALMSFVGTYLYRDLRHKEATAS